MSGHQTKTPEQLNEVIVWGTGSLAERYLAVAPDNLSVSCFVDSGKTDQASAKREFRGISVVTPEQLPSLRVCTVIICSTYINEIIPVCFAHGITEGQIKVVLPRSLECVPLSRFSSLGNNEYYFLPWLQLEQEISPSLSSDIVFPDVYKEITKSVAYAFVSSVEGDFAEFGTCSGFSASLIAHGIDYYSRHLANHETTHDMRPRELCLFDSFQGFPASTKAPDLDSPHVASGIWAEGTAKGLSEAQLQSLCSQFLPAERVVTYPGWYKDTLSTIEQERTFAFVHMDCDLYESTYDVLYHLLDQKKLNEGAVLLFDNWYCNRASKAFGEQRAWTEINEQFDIECTHVGMYACVGHKLIIHGYSKK